MSAPGQNPSDPPPAWDWAPVRRAPAAAASVSPGPRALEARNAVRALESSREDAAPSRGPMTAGLVGMAVLALAGVCVLAVALVTGRSGIWTGAGLLAVLAWFLSRSLLRKARESGAAAAVIARYRYASFAAPVVVVLVVVRLLTLAP